MKLQKKKPKLSMILFIYNEENALKYVVEELIKTLNKAYISHQIILVEGGSNDSSFKIAKELAIKYPQCIAVKSGNLIGEKITRGLEEVKGEYTGIMYSDGQVNPAVIPSFLSILEKKNIDMVKGVRKNRSGYLRYITSWFFNFISCFLFSIKTKDINGHPKLFPSKLIPALNLKVKDETIDLEILVRSKKLNLNIKEIPVQERDRIGGSSYVNILVSINMFKNILSYKWGKKRFIFQ